MRFLGFTLICAFVWVALDGSPRDGRFIMGIVLGILLMTLEQSRLRRTDYWIRAKAVVRIFVLFVTEIVIANWEQLKIVLAPRIRVEPRWIQYHMKLETPQLQALFSAMITLTPGTCSVDVDPQKRLVWIHALNASDVPGTVARIYERLEEPLLRLEKS